MRNLRLGQNVAGKRDASMPGTDDVGAFERSQRTPQVIEIASQPLRRQHAVVLEHQGMRQLRARTRRHAAR